MATCAKGLLNGTCVGTDDNGKCEVNPDKDCGWYLIYHRLKELGRLEDYAVPLPTRDYSLQDIPNSLRRTIWWGLEVPEQDGPL